MTRQTKRTKAWTGDRLAAHPVGDAIRLVKENAKAKFDESIEIAVNLGVDPRHADQQVRGVVNLPSGTGRDVRVAVIARDAKADEAKAAGADIVGAEELVERIQGGFMEFDRVIATNLTAAFHATQLAAPHLIAAGGGVVVNMSSVNALLTIPALLAYNVEKGGLNQLTRNTAIAMAPHNIPVGGLGPGIAYCGVRGRLRHARWHLHPRLCACQRPVPGPLAGLAKLARGRPLTSLQPGQRPRLFGGRGDRSGRARQRPQDRGAKRPAPAG